MLPRRARLSNSTDFRRATAKGVRVGRPTLVVHAGRVDGSDGTRVGFVVSKQVGNAVVRNRVKRRLRHLAADQLPSTPPGLDLVVRALPAAATSPVALSMDLRSAWAKALAKLGAATP